MNILHFFRVFTIFLIVFFSITFELSAGGFKDSLLLDGTEKVVNYGLDSTHHWWAITQPFANKYRLIVDGKQTDVYSTISKPLFSPDGNRWASLAFDNGKYTLITESQKTDMQIGFNYMQYSPNSKVLAYSYLYEKYATIMVANKTYKVSNPVGYFYMTKGGERVAYMEQRGDRVVMIANGVESPLFDEIKPMGYWYNGQMMYAARTSNLWEVYRGSEQLTESFSDIIDVAMNLNGNVAAVLAQLTSGREVGILFSDEYYEPLVGQHYDMVSNLILHPTLPMLSYIAKQNENERIVLNNTEYFGGQENGEPMFSYDGSELYFIGCNVDCFININGRQYNVVAQIPIDRSYAVKPKSLTFAYTTSSSLIIYFLEKNNLIDGKMMDAIGSARYNWRTDRYEALGKLSERLYFISYKF